MKVHKLSSLIISSLHVKAHADSAAAQLQLIKDLAKNAFYVETFEEQEIIEETRWIKSTHENYVSQNVSLDKYFTATKNVPTDTGLLLAEASKHYGLSTKLYRELVIDGTPEKSELVIQYEVKLQKGLSCGGAYIKLLRADDSIDLLAFHADTPYVIMFGPDKCGATDKVHFIIQIKNPVTGAYEAKHLQNPPSIKSDQNTHVYTLVVRDDNTFEILIDQKSELKGSLLDSFDPPVAPPKEIEDPEDSKPENWVDDVKIPDPSAEKPSDWDEDAPMRILDENAVKPDDWLEDEAQTIDDPSAKKPQDWDDEDDGEWVPPRIPNPKCQTGAGCGPWVRPTKANPAYKGKWKAPMIDNPDYIGEWKPRQIPNPHYYDLENPARMDPIGALAIEVWTTVEGIVFDNFWLGHDQKKALEFSKLTWEPKHKVEVARNPVIAGAEHGIKADILERFLYLSTLAEKHPYVALATIFSALFSLSAIFYVCLTRLCAKKRTEKLAKKEDKSADKAEKSSDSAEAVSSETQKLRQRKKAPQTKDD